MDLAPKDCAAEKRKENLGIQETVFLEDNQTKVNVEEGSLCST